MLNIFTKKIMIGLCFVLLAMNVVAKDIEFSEVWKNCVDTKNSSDADLKIFDVDGRSSYLLAIRCRFNSAKELFLSVTDRPYINNDENVALPEGWVTRPFTNECSERETSYRKTGQQYTCTWHDGIAVTTRIVEDGNGKALPISSRVDRISRCYYRHDNGRYWCDIRAHVSDGIAYEVRSNPDGKLKNALDACMKGGKAKTKRKRIDFDKFAGFECTGDLASSIYKLLDNIYENGLYFDIDGFNSSISDEDAVKKRSNGDIYFGNDISMFANIPAVCSKEKCFIPFNMPRKK